MSKVVVSRVESDADGDPLGYPPRWQVTVQRIPENQTHRQPSASDVPPDIRAGLRAWLDTAEVDRG